ncbi:CDP-alcohol phosphatidyltransferase family protein [Streptomyces sp. NPDC054794]
MKGDIRATHEKLHTVANLITLFRFLSLPVFIYFMIVDAWTCAWLLMLMVAVSDGLDGYVARRFDQVTRIGAVADRVADRLCILTLSCMLGVANIIPWWLAGLIIGRDVALFAVVTYAFRGPMPVSATKTGKTATAFLLIGVPALIARQTSVPQAQTISTVAIVLAVLGLILYYVSGFQYARVARTTVIGRHLASSPRAEASRD